MFIELRNHSLFRTAGLAIGKERGTLRPQVEMLFGVG